MYSSKRQYTKRDVLQILGSASAVALAGCTGSGDGTDDGTEDMETGDEEIPEPSHGGTVRMGVEPTLFSMDPRSRDGLTTMQVHTALYDRLLNFRELEEGGFELEGGLAESWEWDSETEFVANIREDADFWNGEPVTAEDAAHTYRTAIDDITLAAGGDFGVIASDLSFTAVDDKTLLIDTGDGHHAFLEEALATTIGIVHKETEESRDIRFDPMGSGPFELDERVGEDAMLTANDDYWKTDSEGRDLPYLDRLEFYQYSSHSEAGTALSQGELEWITQVNPSDLELLENNDETKLHRNLIGNQRGILHFNVTEPPYDDEHARKAVLHALDWQEIVDIVYLGTAEKAGNQASPPHLVDLGLEDPYDGVDVETAEDHLEQSPYDREEFEVTSYATTAADDQVALLETMQGQLDDRLDFQFDIQLVDDETWRTRHQDLEFGIGIKDWSGGWDPSFYLEMVFSGEFFNWGGYENEEVDELFIQQSRTADPDARAEVLAEINEIVLDEAGKYFPFHRHNVFGVDADLYGVEAPLQLMPNFEYMYLDR